MPKGSRSFGGHGTRRVINGSLAAENSGHVSGTVKHSQYECAVVERLEDDQVISVLPYLANERDGARRIVERDVVADLLQVNFGLWCEVRAHSLRALFSHFGVLALQTVKHLGGRFRFAAAPTLFDFAT
jgi:hypothetical protein